MNPEEYKKKIENELIKEFSDKFYEKVGYRPTVITDEKNNGRIVITLVELEKYFESYLPTLYGRIPKLSSKDRSRPLVELRSIFFYIGRTMGYSLKELGGYMGGKDHTTVIHNINTFKNLYETEVAFKNKYYLILNQIKKDYESSTMEYLDQVELES